MPDLSSPIYDDLAKRARNETEINDFVRDAEAVCIIQDAYYLQSAVTGFWKELEKAGYDKQDVFELVMLKTAKILVDGD